MKIYGVYKERAIKGLHGTEGLQFDCFCLKKEDAIEKIKKQYNDVINYCKCGISENHVTVFEPYQEEKGYAYLRLYDVEYKWNLVELEVKE